MDKHPQPWKVEAVGLYYFISDANEVVVATFVSGREVPDYICTCVNKRKRLDFSEMREMLKAMQAGEMTVNRGIELLEIWSAGNYTEDQLPPVNHEGLVGEDETPLEVIARLRNLLKEMCEEFRGHDLPYGSEAYANAIKEINDGTF